MLKIIRQEKIINALENENNQKISDLCSMLNVSIATIHRDLDELERSGRIKKVFGGVVLNTAQDIETKNIIRLNTNVEEKKRVALKALDYVENGDCLFIDNSTTCYYFAKMISESNFKDIVIVTNSLLIPGLFIKNDGVQVVSTGGLLVKEMNSFAGPCSIAAINEFNGTKFFFSVEAISISGGLSDIYSIDLVSVKREMFKKSKTRICLVDSSKFNKIGQSKIFNLDEVDAVITDSKFDMDKRRQFIDVRVNLIIA